jgi:hypothetical protein
LRAKAEDPKELRWSVIETNEIAVT